MYKLLALIILLFASPLSAESLTLEQVQEAACRVGTYNSYGSPVAYGSGTVVSLDDKDVWVLTNGHVVEGTVNATLEFFDKGRVSTKIPAKTLWRQYINSSSIDMALIHASRADLGGYTPRVIKLAPVGYDIKPDLLIKGAGCPSARWLQSWQSRITKNEGETIDFLMPPQEGQSGSGVLADVQVPGGVDTRLIGIVTWRYSDVDGDYGAGPSIMRINQILRREAKPDKLPTRYRKMGPELVAFQSDGICDDCGLSKELHIGSDLKCPRCQKHGLTYNEHLGQGLSYQQFCSPDGCFPWGRPRGGQVPPQPGPPQLGPSQPVPGNGQVPPNIFGGTDAPQAPAVDAEKEAMKDALKRAAAEIEKLSKQSAEDKANLDKLAKEKIALVDQNDKTNLSLQERVDKAKELEQLLKDKKTWLDEQLGEGNHTNLERLIFLILGGGLFTTIWSKYIHPFLLRRMGKLPLAILEGIGQRRLKKYLDSIKGGSGKVYNIESYDEEFDSDDEDPPINIVQDDEPVAQPQTVKKKYELAVSGQIDHKHEVQISRTSIETIKQLFKGLEADGETDPINQWAMRASIYKEAVSKLRRRELKDIDGETLLVGKDVSEFIEKYVTDRLYSKIVNREMEVFTDNQYSIELQAYEGFLYNQAVEKLRTDSLEVKTFSHEAVANAIETYVKKQFLSKVLLTNKGR